jgi:hypothetical protein
MGRKQSSKNAAGVPMCSIAVLSNLKQKLPANQFRFLYQGDDTEQWDL